MPVIAEQTLAIQLTHVPLVVHASAQAQVPNVMLGIAISKLTTIAGRADLAAPLQNLPRLRWRLGRRYRRGSFQLREFAWLPRRSFANLSALILRNFFKPLIINGSKNKEAASKAKTSILGSFFFLCQSILPAK